MSLMMKLAGVLTCCLGLLIWYLDYIIFTATGALTAWIAGAIGINGMGMFGLQLVGWMLTLGIMIFILLCGAYVILSGITMISGD